MVNILPSPGGRLPVIRICGFQHGLLLHRSCFGGRVITQCREWVGCHEGTGLLNAFHAKPTIGSFIEVHGTANAKKRPLPWIRIVPPLINDRVHLPLYKLPSTLENRKTRPQCTMSQNGDASSLFAQRIVQLPVIGHFVIVLTCLDKERSKAMVILRGGRFGYFADKA